MSGSEEWVMPDPDEARGNAPTGTGTHLSGTDFTVDLIALNAGRDGVLITFDNGTTLVVGFGPARYPDKYGDVVVVGALGEFTVSVASPAGQEAVSGTSNARLGAAVEFVPIK